MAPGAQGADRGTRGADQGTFGIEPSGPPDWEYSRLRCCEYRRACRRDRHHGPFRFRKQSGHVSWYGAAGQQFRQLPGDEDGPSGEPAFPHGHDDGDDAPYPPG